MDGEFWDERYGAEPSAYGEAPSRYMMSLADRLPSPPAEAFAPGDGQGRNGLWLARRGHPTLAVDLSKVAMEQLAARAAREGLPLRAEHADLSTFDCGRDRFGIVAAIWLHLPASIRPSVHASLSRSLIPGGLLVVEAFHPKQIRYREEHGSGGPADPSMTYDLDLLASDFADLSFLEGTETEDVLDEGPFHRGLGFVTRALFRKPPG